MYQFQQIGLEGTRGVMKLDNNKHWLLNVNVNGNKKTIIYSMHNGSSYRPT